jgi:hypothetical protein
MCAPFPPVLRREEREFSIRRHGNGEARTCSHSRLACDVHGQSLQSCSRAAWYGIIFVVNQSLYKWYDTLTLRCLFCARTTAEKQPPPRLFCFVCSFVRSAVSFGLVASSVAPCAASVTSPLARPVAVGSHNRPIRLHPSTAWSLLWLLLLASVRDGQMATAPIRPPVRSATRVAVPC